jgi:hypothetical protein
MSQRVFIYGLYGRHQKLELDLDTEKLCHLQEQRFLQVDDCCYEVQGLFQRGHDHYINVRYCPNPHLRYGEQEPVYLTA